VADNTFSSGREKILMSSWRTKLIFLLVVYFAGFATAIYTLAPAPEKRAHQHREKQFAYAAIKSDRFAKSFNRGMHKAIDFGKDATRSAGAFLKQKLDER